MSFSENGGLALLSLGFAPTFLARAAAAVSTRTKLLIAVFQRGAVDGLNVVVPSASASITGAGRRLRFRDRAMEEMRRSISTGSSPSIRVLRRSYRCIATELAVVHACGSPDSTRSHFDAQDYMESATPGVKSTDDGWLNRT